MKKSMFLKIGAGAVGAAVIIAVVVFFISSANPKPVVENPASQTSSGGSPVSGSLSDSNTGSDSLSENLSSTPESFESLIDVDQSTDPVSEEALSKFSGNSFTSSNSTGAAVTSGSGVALEGLSDASAVGIDKDLFYNEIKYPVPSHVDYVIKAVDFGVKANDNRDDTVGLQAAIAAAKGKSASSTKEILLPAGDLDFVEGFNKLDYTYGIVIDGIENLTLAGQNTNVYFHGKLGFRGLHLVSCKNFLITKINFDWGKTPFSMGTIESMDTTAKTAVIKVNAGYAVDAGTQVISYEEFDKRTSLPRDNGNFLYNLNDHKDIIKVEYLGNSRLRLTFSSALTQAPAGTKVALAHAVHFSQTFILDQSTNVKFETVSLYASLGMGLVAETCTNLYFNRFNCITKPGTDRLMTCTADILHLSNTAGEIVITNSTLENSHDDALNVNGHLLRVQAIDGEKARVIWPGGMNGTFRPVVGEVYELSDISTLEVKKTLTIATVETSFDGYIVTFKEGISGVEVNNALGNVTRAAKLTFKNNLVRNKRNRGIVVQTRNVEISNNCFSYIMHGAIMLISEVNVWNESIAPRDVVIKNNKFVNNSAFAQADIDSTAFGPGFSVGSPKTIRNLTIENNFFAYSANSAMSFRGASNIKIKNNLIYNPALSPINGRANCAVFLENASDLVFDTNKVYGGTNFGFKSVMAVGGVDKSTITLVGNSGIEAGDVYGDEKNVEIGKNGSAVINLNDNSLNDWTNAGTAIAMNACTNVAVEEVSLSSILPSDFTVDAKMLWKDDGIYLSYDVTDNSVQWNESSWWLGDGCEIFISTETASSNNVGAVKLTNEDTAQLFMKPASAGGSLFYQPRTSDAVMQNTSKFKLNIWATAKGYAGEAFIPFSAMPGLKTSIDGGKAIAMSLNFGDSDAGNALFKTFSTVRHPTSENKMIPANMTKFIFKK